MALDLVTGYKGQNHVTAEQWADFNRGIYGDAAILPIGNKMQVEIQTVNQITVKDGTGVFDGRQVYIGYGESENIAIESGTQEMLRNDIVVIKYTKDETSGVESVAFEVVTGMPAESDPADPSYQDMDIRTGVFVSQKPFCRVRLNGVAIEGVDMLVEVKEFAEHVFNPPVANLTATEPGRALDATMGKQLKDDFDQLNSSLAFNTAILDVGITAIYNAYMVTIIFSAGTSTYNAGEWNTIAEIPENIRPDTVVTFAALNNETRSDADNTPVWARVTTDGHLQIYAYSDRAEINPIGSVSYAIS